MLNLYCTLEMTVEVLVFPLLYFGTENAWIKPIHLVCLSIHMKIVAG